MAAVWEGLDEVLVRSVAVKILHPHLAEDQVFLERFRREAISVARLSHPNIVATFDAGNASNGTAYIVMELVRGTTLRHRLEAGALPPGVAVGIAIQIADALRHAHTAGLVHRDIKPANILLCKGDTEAMPQVKVADFGIAKATEGMGLDLTRSGMVLGTAKYLSPEQVEGREPDARADLYSLGVVLFEMLTGEPPFVGPNDMTVALARLDGPAPQAGARCEGLPPALDRLVASLLARDPDDRPPSAGAVRHELASIQREPGGPVEAGWPVEAGGGPRGKGAGPGGKGKGADLTATMSPSTASGGGRRNATGPTGLLGPATPTGNARTAISRLPYQAGQRAGLRPRRPRWPGWLVAGLAAVAAVMAAFVLFGWGSTSSPRSPAAILGGGLGPGGTFTIKTVAVFHLERDADNAARVGYTHDANPATIWFTDRYYGPNFGRLRSGLGLAITLDGSHVLRHLKIESPTHGWSAEVYVAAAVPTSASLAPWGTPVAAKQSIDGTNTFDLGGRQAAAILLWITDLGPGYQAGVAELAVS